MKTINYNIIKNQIRKSKYYKKGYFEEIKRGKETYISPIKYHSSKEFRDLAILASFPYIIKIAWLARERWLSYYLDTNYMDMDDFFQDIIVSILHYWKWWDIKKSKLTTAMGYFGMWVVSDKVRRIRKYRNRIKRIYKFMAENFQQVLFDEFLERMKVKDGFQRTRDYLEGVDDAIILEQFLREIRGILDQSEYSVFRMKFLEGQSCFNIAKRLGVSEPTVCNKLNGCPKVINKRKYFYTKKNPNPDSIRGKIQTLKKAWGY